MAFYTSHNYLEANPELLASLKSDPILSTGLFHLRKRSFNITNSVAKNKYPQNGIVVIREVCDPNKVGSNHDEARVHQRDNDPIISWWKLQGPNDLEVIYPSAIPALAFGKIYLNNKNNPLPPIEFLQFLKQLSVNQKVSIVFYHHYSAYEDELANSEYAWIFDKEDTVLIRHVNEPYSIVQYASGIEPKIIISDRTEYSQPILQIVMKALEVSLHRFDDRRPYFYDFRWIDYRV